MKDPMVTEAEWPIMEVLWNKETATAAEIVEQVSPVRGTSMRTIKTLLRRLVAKNLVNYTIDPADARVYHYRAAVKRRQCEQQRNSLLLATVYQGDVNQLLVRFISDSRLTRAELEALEMLLQQKKEAEDDG